MYNMKETPRERRLRKAHEKDFIRGGSKLYHSGAYHRFFEGYSEEQVTDENGKRRIVRVYVGNYYKRDCDDHSWRRIKAVYLLFYLAAAALYVFALTRRAPCNTVWYTAAPGLLSAIPMIFLISTLVSCMAAKRMMEAGDYHYVFRRLPTICLVASGLMLLTALMMLLFAALNPAHFSGTLLPLLCCTAAGILIGVIGYLEHRANYLCLENPVRPGENSVVFPEPEEI